MVDEMVDGSVIGYIIVPPQLEQRALELFKDAIADGKTV